MSKKLLTEKEASDYISMSRSFLRQSRMNGNLSNRTPGPSWIHIGTRTIRYPIEELDRWIESHPLHSPALAMEED